MNFHNMNAAIAPKKRKRVTNESDSDFDVNHSYMEYKQYRGPGGVSTSQLVQINGKKCRGPSSSTSRFVPAQGQISYMSSTSVQMAVPKKKPPIQNSNKAKLRSKVLKILNKGTQKDVEQLATVGVKAAEQIITKRLLTGLYKRLKDLEDIPGWQGKRFERFMTANQLND